jgi:2-polyprenyl-3-methyl-5-hydroxy-6-metoxy-1,4-benzoquinol methylase
MIAAVKRLVKWCLGRTDVPAEPAGEKAAEYYDRTFHEDANWSAHYTASVDYYIWTVIVDRVRRAGSRGVLEIGCGSGQLAHAIHDTGAVERYCGFDFSSARIEQARRNVPSFSFELANAFETDLYERATYDLVIVTEFLEHVEDDLTVIQRIRPDARVIGLVPNFPYVSHVRHFASVGEVAQRYGRFFRGFTVDAIPMKVPGSVAFLFDGIRIS